MIYLICFKLCYLSWICILIFFKHWIYSADHCYYMQSCCRLVIHLACCTSYYSSIPTPLLSSVNPTSKESCCVVFRKKWINLCTDLSSLHISVFLCVCVCVDEIRNTWTAFSFNMNVFSGQRIFVTSPRSIFCIWDFGVWTIWSFLGQYGHI